MIKKIFLMLVFVFQSIYSISIISDTKIDINTDKNSGKNKNIKLKKAITVSILDAKNKSYEVYIDSADDSQDNFYLYDEGSTDKTFEIQYQLGGKTYGKPSKVFTIYNDSQTTRALKFDITIFTKNNPNLIGGGDFSHSIKFTLNEL